MGKSASKPTVLEYMVKNFKKGFSRDYGVKLSPGKLCTLCTLEWPSFGVGWPPEGTLDVFTVTAVYNVITGDPGHPDQFPYIDQWLEIAYLRPPWVWFCTTDQGQCSPVQEEKLVSKRCHLFIKGNPRTRPLCHHLMCCQPHLQEPKVPRCQIAHHLLFLLLLLLLKFLRRYHPRSQILQNL